MTGGHRTPVIATSEGATNPRRADRVRLPHQPHPRLSDRRGLRAARRRRDARLQRVARPAAAAGRRGDHARRDGRSTAIPDPSNARLRGALSDRYGVPANRIAIGNGSVEILLAAGEALLEPGAEVVYAWPSFSVYPHLAAATGATRDHRDLDDERPPRPRRDARRDHRGDAAGHRLQPEQPDVDRAAARAHRRVRRAGPAARRADPRRGLLRVQPARRPRRVDRAARAPPEPRPAADLLQGLRPRRPARRLRAVRQRALPPGRRPGPPAVLLQRRRAGRGDRGAPAPGRGCRARRAGGRRAGGDAVRPRATSASRSPSRRRTSPGCTSPRTSRRRRSSTGSPSAGVLVRAGRRARPRRRAARHLRPARRERRGSVRELAALLR